MLKDLQTRGSRLASIAGRWDAVIERLQEIAENDKSGGLDLEPTLYEVELLTQEIRARAGIYDPALCWKPGGAYSSPEAALRYLRGVAGSLKTPEAPDRLAIYKLREIAKAVDVLLKA